MGDRRLVVFGALLVACLAVAVGYTLRARSLSTSVAPPANSQPTTDQAILAHVLARPHLFFLESPTGDAARQLAVVPLNAVDGQRYMTPLYCRRVAFGGHEGLCLGGGRTAWAFDSQFRVTASYGQPGIPSRSRVADDGALGSMTWFVAGHSYAEASFSTQTLLVEPKTGRTIADLEQFAISRDGAPFRFVDFNFWGVTFVPGNPKEFYATVASGGRTYLLQGDIAERTGRVLRENVECPSISPDGTRLAFKKRVDPLTANEWRLAVLDLRTMDETPIAGENHSVDDQVEWLDNEHILYAIQEDASTSTGTPDIWVASLDGTEAPRILLPGALSPIVVRD
jgi:hypothetical protein